VVAVSLGTIISFAVGALQCCASSAIFRSFEVSPCED
jgi:hypothetical protein